MPAVAQCVHAVPGRVRYRILERRGDAEFFRGVQELLRQHDGIQTVAVNAATASILVHHTGEADEIAAAAQAAGLFEVAPMPTPSLGAQARSGLRTADRDLRRITDGRVDMNSALFLGLTGLAMHQALKGNLLAPASTLLWYALEALRWSERKP
jgi:hypothetical protein